MKKFFAILLSILLIFNLSCCTQRELVLVDPNEQIVTTGTSISDGNFVISSNPYTFIEPENLYSPAVFVLDADTNTCIYNCNGSEYIYPASMTKIMTALVAIENIPDLSTQIIVKQSQIDPLYLAGASLTGFRGGESVSAIDLLYGVLLPSGAESCSALAEYIAGSNENFVDLMNKKAKELELAHTNFVTDSGLHDVCHYSSCEDVAKLLSYALQNEILREIMQTEKYTCSNGLVITSTLLPKLPEKENRILGGKTGYTPEAGLCLASFGTVNNHNFIVVTAAASGDHTTPQYNILDAIKIFDSIK